MDTPPDEADWRRHREMAEHLRKICVTAVGACEDLPTPIRENYEALGVTEITNHDQSYIDFLDEQIALAPRGPEWNQRLQVRRSNLAPHVGRELAAGRLQFGTLDYWIIIDPVAGAVVHWETYEKAE